MTDLTIEDLYSARLALATKRPYLAMVLWSLRPVAAPGLGTLGVSEDLRLFYDPQVPWRGDELQAVLYHEAMHVIQEHPERARKAGFNPEAKTRKQKAKSDQFDQKLWWAATDCEINDDIIKDGFTLPQVGVGGKPHLPCVPSAYQLQDGGIAEEYYAQLKKQAKKNKNQMECQCGANTVFIKTQESGGKCPDGSPAQPVDKAFLKQLLQETSEAIEEWQKALAEGQKPDGTPMSQTEQREARSKLAGQEEQALKKISSQIQAKYGNNWRKLLGQIIRGTAARTSGMTDYTYTRPSRRSPPGIIMPSLYKPMPKVVVVLDISDSMEGAPSQYSLHVLKEIIHACGVEWLNVIPTNHIAHDMIVIRRQNLASELNFGGGTNMPQGLIASYNHSPDLVIIVTDGETPWDKARDKSIPVIAALVDANDHLIKQVPDWMKVVPITIPEDFKTEVA